MWRIRGAVLALLLRGGVGLGIVVHRLLDARAELASGARDVSAASALAGSGSALYDTAVRVQLERRLRHAEGDLGAARSSLAMPGAVFAVLERLPLVGREIGAAPAATDATYFATRSATEILHGIEPGWRAARLARASPPLAALTLKLAKERGTFARAVRDEEAAARALKRLSVDSGNVALDRATAQLRARLPELRAAADWLVATPEGSSARPGI